MRQPSPATPSSAPELVAPDFAAIKARQHTTQLLEQCNVAGSDSLVVPGEYLEVVVTRRLGELMH